jgi:hypothetical protein
MRFVASAAFTALIALLVLSVAARAGEFSPSGAAGALGATAGDSRTAAAGCQLILSADEVAALRAHIAAGNAPYSGAWAQFRDGRARAALAATPRVSVGPIRAFAYRKLDTDSRYARNAAIAYAASGKIAYAAKARRFLVAWARANHPATFSFTRDYQGGYHQSYGAFSFAFAYDLTRDAGVYSAADRQRLTAWFARWAKVMHGYQNNFMRDYWFSHAGRGTYDWPGTRLSYDRTDYFTGRDTAAAPAAAWLACAIVAGDTASLDKLFDPAYKLSVPRILHGSCAPDNDGDGAGTVDVPQVLIKAAGYYDNPERGGCLDYMSYNARLASILYQMADHLGLATGTMRDELHSSWLYLSRFAGAHPLRSPAPHDVIHWDLFLSRMQSALHVYGEQPFLDAVRGKQFPRTQFYEEQFLGPTVLTQP